jgi:hypothetical protein
MPSAIRHTLQLATLLRTLLLLLPPLVLLLLQCGSCSNFAATATIENTWIRKWWSLGYRSWNTDLAEQDFLDCELLRTRQTLLVALAAVTTVILHIK